MKSICIDGYNIGMPKGSGIATYGRNLLINNQALGFETQVLYGPPTKLNRSDVVNEAALVEAEPPTRKVAKGARFRRTLTSRLGRQAHKIHPTGEVIWPANSGGRPAADAFWTCQDLFYIANRSFNVYDALTPVTFASSAPDAMNWTATLPLYAKGTANIYTIHDLIPLKLPHTTLDNKEKYFRLCKEITSRADHIIAVSETTRQDIIRILGVEEKRVTTTYQSAIIPEVLSSRPQREVEIELEGVFELGWKGYFLFFGAIEPKKNLGRIVEAYLASGVETPLVIVGGRAWLDEGETALINQVKRDGGPSSKKIRQYEFMSQSMLVSLIRGAKATLFPSLYEGFGLPVLESMLLETAVVTANNGALAEISGDAALCVDPYDVQAITRAIQAVDIDESLRAELVDKGTKQARLFSPERYQERLRELYGRLNLL